MYSHYYPSPLPAYIQEDADSTDDMLPKIWQFAEKETHLFGSYSIFIQINW